MPPTLSQHINSSQVQIKFLMKRMVRTKLMTSSRNEELAFDPTKSNPNPDLSLMRHAIL